MIAQCPKCHQKQEVPDPYQGTTIKCPHCKQMVTASECTDLPDPLHLKQVTAVGDSFFAATWRVAIALFNAAIGLSIVVCGIAAMGNSSQEAVQYLLAVIAMCLLVLVHKK